MSLYIDRLGDGPPLVLLHGWGLNSRVWNGIVPRLRRTWRVILVDLPGHGLSAPLEIGAGLAEVSAAVAPAIPADACILGWSLGGMIAVQLAHEARVHPRHLVLVGSTPQFVADERWPHGIEARVLEAFADRLAQDFGETLRRFLGLQSLGCRDQRRFIRTLQAEVLDQGPPAPAALQDGLRILGEAKLQREFAELDTPISLIHGLHDTLAPYSGAQALCGLNPRARLHTMAAAGHMPFLVDPERFCRHVDALREDA